MKYVNTALTTAFCLFLAVALEGQVSINTSGNAPDPSAMLDIKSNSKGVLVPRMSESQRNAIVDPALGLLVFDTASTHFFFYNGAEWEKINRTDTLSIITDADRDTKIQVEESADEDLIRFDLDGTEHFIMNGPRLNVMNSGQSVLIGESAGASDDLTDNQNVFIGYESGRSNTTGENNISIGYRAMSENTTGRDGVAIGQEALENNTTGWSNTAVGWWSLRDNTTGEYNVGLGRAALAANMTGVNNTAIGSEAGGSMSFGYNNVFLGFGAGRNSSISTTGNNNVILGANAGKTLSGDYNVFVGNGAGQQTLGSRNVFLGSSSGENETGSNKLYIENSSANAENALIYGEFDNNFLALNAQVRINDGTQAEGYVLTSDADGNALWAPSSTPAMVFDTLSGVVLPGSAVELANDDFVFGSTQLDDDDNYDHDSRFFFDKTSSAFRAGISRGKEWDQDSLGSFTVAFGEGTVALGPNSVAMGASSRASSFAAVAIGDHTQALSAYALALGSYTTASQTGATAMGTYSLASAYAAIAMGDYSIASGVSSTAMGGGSIASGYSATAAGSGSMATGSSSTALGDQSIASDYSSFAAGSASEASGNTAMAFGSFSRATNHAAVAMGSGPLASGESSVALGNFTIARSHAEVALGTFNTNYTPLDSNGFNADDRLLVIGNGTSEEDRSDAMVVLKNGDIGIGTSTPNSYLHIETTDALTDAKVYNNSDIGSARFYVGASGGGHINLIANDGGSDLYGIPDGFPGIVTQYKDMVFATGNGSNNSTEKMRLTTNGRLGIGTTDPDVTLQVGEMGDGTTARANAWTMFSDRRWKKNIEIIPDALAKLEKVNGYYYNWKESADTTQQVGVIAQEIQTILPQCVSTDEAGYLSVDYGKLTAWLIQVNKEQQEQIDYLTTENAELHAQTDRIDRLEAMLLDLQTATSEGAVSTSNKH